MLTLRPNATHDLQVGFSRDMLGASSNIAGAPSRFFNGQKCPCRNLFIRKKVLSEYLLEVLLLILFSVVIPEKSYSGIRTSSGITIGRSISGKYSERTFFRYKNFFFRHTKFFFQKKIFIGNIFKKINSQDSNPRF